MQELTAVVTEDTKRGDMLNEPDELFGPAECYGPTKECYGPTKE